MRIASVSQLLWKNHHMSSLDFSAFNNFCLYFYIVEYIYLCMCFMFYVFVLYMSLRLRERRVECELRMLKRQVHWGGWIFSDESARIFLYVIYFYVLIFISIFFPTPRNTGGVREVVLEVFTVLYHLDFSLSCDRFTTSSGGGGEGIKNSGVAGAIASSSCTSADVYTLSTRPL